MPSGVVDIQTVNYPIQHEEEVRAYAQAEYGEFFTIRPALTIFRPNSKVMTIRFPFAETPQDRLDSLIQGSFASCFFRPFFYRLIIDTYLPLKGSEDMIDSVLIFTFNSDKCKFHPMPYRANEEGIIEWLSIDVLDLSGDAVDKKQELLDFAGMLSFHGATELNIKFYLQYLETKGFEVMFHNDFTADNVGVFASRLV